MGMVIAKNLKLFALRKRRNWTQLEAAKMIGLPINVYARIERGEVSGKVENWTKIQEVYGIPDEEMWSVVKGR